MSFNHLDYCQYLLSSPKNYTLTNLADHKVTVSHDTINKFLRENKISSPLIGNNVSASIVEDAEASIVFDDTVLDKRYSEKIELVRRLSWKVALLVLERCFTWGDPVLSELFMGETPKTTLARKTAFSAI